MRSIRHFRTGIGLACLLTAGLAGQVLGASRVAYTVELGGDNHAAQWKTGTRVAYTRGSSADGQTFHKFNLLNYAIVLEASGIHNQSGHASDGKEIYGAANSVFNIEFLDANDQPVGDVIFRSTINDGTGSDPFQAAAFALGYTKFGTPGRLIDNTTLGGPRLEPIYTYPHAPSGSGTWVGMGAGYKEWVRTGSSSLITMPGVGMVDVPPAYVGGPRRAGMGIVPVAEGQIDVSNLLDGTYKLRVTPGNGNNVLRGDFDMVAATNRPAFAVASNETAGHTITFNVCDCPPVPDGVVARRIFYNNSVWDGNDPAINSNDDAAIATDKTPLLPGNTATFANVSNYDKGINGIMIDIGNLTREPVLGSDIQMLMGNTNSPFDWSQEPPPPSGFTVRWGAGVDGSDRVVITWPDYPQPGSIPNSKWVLIGIWSGSGTLYNGPDEFFCYGLAIGEGGGPNNGPPDLIVNSNDEYAARTHGRTGFNPAPIDFIWDYNRDKLVNSNDQYVSRTHTTTGFTSLKFIVFP